MPMAGVKLFYFFDDLGRIAGRCGGQVENLPE